MVVDVKKAHLIQVSLQEHDVGVKVLVELANVKDVDPPSHSHLLDVVSLSPETVIVGVRLVARVGEHVRAQEDEEDVVEVHQSLEVRRRRRLLARSSEIGIERGSAQGESRRERERESRARAGRGAMQPSTPSSLATIGVKSTTAGSL